MTSMAYYPVAVSDGCGALQIYLRECFHRFELLHLALSR